MDLIALLQEKLREVGAVLSGHARDESFSCHLSMIPGMCRKQPICRRQHHGGRNVLDLAGRGLRPSLDDLDEIRKWTPALDVEAAVDDDHRRRNGRHQMPHSTLGADIGGGHLAQREKDVVEPGALQRADRSNDLDARFERTDLLARRTISSG